MEDGYIVIRAKVDNSGFNKDIQKLIEKAEKSSDKIERLMEQKGKLEIDNAEFERKILKSEQQLNELRQQMKELENIKMTTTSEWEFKEVDQELQNISIQYNELVAKNEKDNQTLSLKETKLEGINRKIEREKAIRDEINKKIQQSNKGLLDIGKVTEMSDKLGNSINGVVKKVIKMSLALIGVRTAISLITRSFSILSQYNDELATKMQNMRLVLAVALEPIIMRLVSWFQTLLAYINYLTTAWFGLNLFARASELSTKKMANNLGAGAGSAKEIKKQLAGFDEMNVLQDNNTGGGGGAGGGATMPEFNLNPNVKIPKWLEWIKDNGKTIAKILSAIGAGLLTLKAASKLGKLLGMTTGLGKFAGGLALVAAGVVLLVTNIVDLINNWDEMSTKEKIISASLAALGAALIALGFAIATGFSAATLGIGLLIAEIVTFIAVLGTTLYKLDQEEKGLTDVKTAQDNLTNAKKKAKQAEDEYISAIDNAEAAQKALDEAQQRTGISGKELNDQVEKGILNYRDMTTEQKEVYKAYRNNETAQEDLTEKTEGLTKAKQKEKEKTWDLKLATDAGKGSYEEYRDAVIDAYNKGEISADEAAEYISKAMGQMDDKTRETFAENIPDSIKKGLDPSRYDYQAQKMRTWWSGLMGSLYDSYSNFVNKVNNKHPIISAAGVGAFGTWISGSYRTGALIDVPRLAAGGVINQPGRGVPIGIAGEAGKEGVLPLTDTNAMQLLGKEIGKWITINANIINSMNGRVISRELQKINNENDFAFNS